MGYLLDVSWYH